MIVEQHDSKSKPARKPRGRKQNKVEDCAPLTAKTDSLTSTTEDPVVVPDNVDVKLNKKSEVARQSASQDGVSGRPTRARRKPKKLMDDETPSTSKPDIRDKMPSTSKTTEACNETSKQLLNGKEINDEAQQTEAEQTLPDKISTSKNVKSAAKTKRDKSKCEDPSSSDSTVPAGIDQGERDVGSKSQNDSIESAGVVRSKHWRCGPAKALSTESTVIPDNIAANVSTEAAGLEGPISHATDENESAQRPTRSTRGKKNPKNAKKTTSINKDDDVETDVKLGPGTSKTPDDPQTSTVNGSFLNEEELVDNEVSAPVEAEIFTKPKRATRGKKTPALLTVDNDTEAKARSGGANPVKSSDVSTSDEEGTNADNINYQNSMTHSDNGSMSAHVKTENDTVDSKHVGTSVTRGRRGRLVKTKALVSAGEELASTDDSPANATSSSQELPDENKASTSKTISGHKTKVVNEKPALSASRGRRGRAANKLNKAASASDAVSAAVPECTLLSIPMRTRSNSSASERSTSSRTTRSTRNNNTSQEVDSVNKPGRGRNRNNKQTPTNKVDPLCDNTVPGQDSRSTRSKHSSTQDPSMDTETAGEAKAVRGRSTRSNKTSKSADITSEADLSEPVQEATAQTNRRKRQTHTAEPDNVKHETASPSKKAKASSSKEMVDPAIQVENQEVSSARPSRSNKRIAATENSTDSKPSLNKISKTESKANVENNNTDDNQSRVKVEPLASKPAGKRGRPKTGQSQEASVSKPESSPLKSEDAPASRSSRRRAVTEPASVNSKPADTENNLLPTASRASKRGPVASKPEISDSKQNKSDDNMLGNKTVHTRKTSKRGTKQITDNTDNDIEEPPPVKSARTTRQMKLEEFSSISQYKEVVDHPSTSKTTVAAKRGGTRKGKSKSAAPADDVSEPATSQLDSTKSVRSIASQSSVGKFNIQSTFTCIPC